MAAGLDRVLSLVLGCLCTFAGPSCILYFFVGLFVKYTPLMAMKGKYRLVPDLVCYHAPNSKISNFKWQKMLKKICRCSQNVSSQSL
jgi:hypothetical protein